MKSLSRVLIIFFSFVIAGHAAGHSTAGQPCFKKYQSGYCTAETDLSYNKAHTTQDNWLLFLAEEDFSIDKHLLFPCTLSKTAYPGYPQQQWITHTHKKQIHLSALITGKLPIYLLHHTLLIPFA